MNFFEARQEYGQEIGGLTRPDFNANFASHYQSKIRPFCAETGLDFGEAANLFSPDPEKVNGRDRPQDATIDLIAYQGHRVFSQPGITASPMQDFFSDKVIQNEKDPSFELGIAYLQNIPRNILDAGIDVDPRYSAGYQRVINSAFSRSDLNRAVDPYATGMLETDRMFRPRLRIMDVVAYNDPLNSRTIEIPIVSEVGDRDTRGTGGGRLPREHMDVGEAVITMSEEGRELEVSDNVRRSSSITIEAVARRQANRARRQENDIVNKICNLIIDGAEAVAWSGTPTSADIIKLHMTPDDDYMITTIVGSLMGVVLYADADVSNMSDTNRPGTAMQRQFLDAILGREVIAKRDITKVTALAGSSKERLGCWDRMHTFAYYTERGGTIS